MLKRKKVVMMLVGPKVKTGYIEPEIDPEEENEVNEIIEAFDEADEYLSFADTVWDFDFDTVE